MARIAVIDDNDDTREVIRIWLERDHNVTEFESAEAFVEVLPSESFDIALVDIRMPQVDGIMLARIVRGQLAPRLPLIAMTAQVIKNTQDTLYRAGFDEVITKPMDLRLLSDMIARVLGLKQPQFSGGKAGRSI